MRDYNQIQFRAPNKKPSKLQQPVHSYVASTKGNVVKKPGHQYFEEEKKDSSVDETSSNANNVSTLSSPDRSDVSSIPKGLNNSTASGSVNVSFSQSVLSSPGNSHRNNNTSASRITNNNHTSQSNLSRQNTTATNQSSSLSLSVGDALHLRRTGVDPEATIAKLRASLQEHETREQKLAAQTAKSDAMIVELRSASRQLQRQLEKLQTEQQQTLQKQRQLEGEVETYKAQQDNNAVLGELQVQLDRAHAQILTADMVRQELEDTLEAEQYTWELRCQDQERQIATLSDECHVLATDLEQCRTQWSEAEHGWNEQVKELQQQLDKAMTDVVQLRKKKDDGDDNGEEGNGGTSSLHAKIASLEQERAELQNCLDEALKELEAVDAELQGDAAGALRAQNQQLQQELAAVVQQQRQRQPGDGVSSDNNAMITEQLQHLYRWLKERDDKDNGNNNSSSNSNSDDHSAMPQDPNELIEAIRSHIDEQASAQQQQQRANVDDPELAEQLQEARAAATHLQDQLTACQGDLKARETSSAELRASLKEAVELLHPLQEAVAKADREKAELQVAVDELQKANSSDNSQQSTPRNKQAAAELARMRQRLDAKDDEIDVLQQQVESLEIQLSKAKLQVANHMVQLNNRSMNSSSSDSATRAARDDLQAKRASERALKKMLRETQDRFASLHAQNQRVEAQNTELHGRLQESSAEQATAQQSRDATEQMARDLQARDVALQELNAEMRQLKQELTSQQALVVELEAKIATAAAAAAAEKEAAQKNISLIEADRRNLEHALARVQDLEGKVAKATKELKVKKHAEKTLNKSLMEALNLVRPLQEHLEDAEQEKKDMEAEILMLRKRLGEEASPSRVLDSSREDYSDHVSYLKNTVLELQKENDHLHDALEDLSASVNQSQTGGDGGGGPSSTLSQKDEVRLRGEIVELKSRYEVTQNRLDEAHNENADLYEELQSRDLKERSLMEEIKLLREKIKSSDMGSTTGARGGEHTAESGKEITDRNEARGRRHHVPYRLT